MFLPACVRLPALNSVVRFVAMFHRFCLVCCTDGRTATAAVAAVLAVRTVFALAVIVAAGLLAISAELMADERSTAAPPDDVASEPVTSKPATSAPVAVSVQTIDQLMVRAWQDAQVQPADMCSDDVFVRRLFLDLAGRIPTLQERDAFLQDGRDNKREHLVDRLLGSEDHVQHLADMLDTLLMGRGNDRRYAERSKHQWRAWLERVIRDNRPWNEVAEQILLARPTSPEDRGAVWFLYERKDDYQKIAEAVAPAFFGIRIDCAQCHDHMMAYEIEQRHYWGLVAFFNRGKNVDTKNGPRVSESAIGGFSEFANLEGSSSPNVLTFFEAVTVNEARPAADDKQEDSDDLYVAASLEGDPRVPVFSRREQFVSQIVQTHPLIARAFVNRMWAMLLGRGIVHPFNEMDSVHPASHPELLDWLSQDFRDNSYNVRRLIRMIVLSRPYQLSSVRPDGVEDPATFAWALERPLTAEQMARSMQQAVQGRFRNDHPLMAVIRQNLPDVMAEHSLTTVGDALFLTNNTEWNQFLNESRQPDHLISRLVALPTAEQRIEFLFATVFGRTADAEERAAVAEMLAVGDDEAALADRLQQVVWAMLTSAEFRLNH